METNVGIFEIKNGKVCVYVEAVCKANSEQNAIIGKYFMDKQNFRSSHFRCESFSVLKTFFFITGK